MYFKIIADAEEPPIHNKGLFSEWFSRHFHAYKPPGIPCFTDRDIFFSYNNSKYRAVLERMNVFKSLDTNPLEFKTEVTFDYINKKNIEWSEYEEWPNEEIHHRWLIIDEIQRASALHILLQGFPLLDSYQKNTMVMSSEEPILVILGRPGSPASENAIKSYWKVARARNIKDIRLVDTIRNEHLKQSFDIKTTPVGILYYQREERARVVGYDPLKLSFSIIKALEPLGFDVYKPPKVASDFITFSSINDLQQRINEKESFYAYIGAEWCTPCHETFPRVNEWAQKTPVINVFRVDVDRSPEIIELIGKDVFPQLVFWDKGQLTNVLEKSSNILSFLEQFIVK